MNNEEKRFTVLCHVNNAFRHLYRDVPASSIEELLDVLSTRIGRQIISASFFNTYSNQYQILLEPDFSILQSNVELLVETEDDSRPATNQAQVIVDDQQRRSPLPHTSRAQQPAQQKRSEVVVEDTLSDGKASTQPSAQYSPTRLTMKARVVEFLRTSLLPLYKKQLLTRDEIILTCSSICQEFMLRRGLSETDLQTVTRLPLSELDEDLLLKLVDAYTVDVSGGDDQSTYRQTVSESGGGGSSRKFGSQRPQLQQRNDFYSSANDEHQQHARRVEERQRSPAVGLNSPPTPSGNNITLEGNLFRQPSVDYYSVPQRSSGGQPISNAEETQAPPSTLFTSVSYSISGSFPLPPNSTNRVGDHPLRCTLASASIVDPDSDIIVTGTVHTKTAVSLVWWLSYGPHRTVLNLDNLYSTRSAVTFQISDSSFILAFRCGVLLPGYEYHVHLTVTANNGVSVGAQCSFGVPPSIGGQLLDEGEKLGLVSQQQRTTMGSTSHYTQHTTHGYYGDGEAGGGSMSPTRRHVDFDEHTKHQDTQTNVNPLQPNPIRAYYNVNPNMTSTTAPTSKGLPEMSVDPSITTTPPTTTMMGGARKEMGATFQEELRRFILEQIQPLYFLSSNPSITEEEFRLVTKNVAATFWFSKPPEAPLDDAMKRSIVQCVKAEIGKNRVELESHHAHHNPEGTSRYYDDQHRR